MRIFIRPDTEQWPDILKRPTMDTQSLEGTVQQILDDVRRRGDVALREYSQKFDRVAPEKLEVEMDAFERAEASLDQSLKDAIRLAAGNIQRFHEQQREEIVEVETMPGVRCWRKSVAIDKVGLYIPGGTAPLFSTVLMLGIPARIAGCKEIVLCTPPRQDGSIHPAILFAASVVGIDRVFKLGGVQAVGGLAYGTETVPKVDKIFGPGNQYVTAAKQLVSREGTAIDMPAGPSEVMVVADRTANPTFVAADLLSQAEHGSDSQVILVAFDQSFIHDVQAEVEKQLLDLPRAEIARGALEHSAAMVVADRQEALRLVNAYAAEHLILSLEDARNFAEGVLHAGSVFLGHYSPESVGDYASGTNHTLPTNGYARTHSGVSLDSFVRKITFQELSAEGLRNIGPAVEVMANAEELAAHKLAVSVRLQNLDD